MSDFKQDHTDGDDPDQHQVLLACLAEDTEKDKDRRNGTQGIAQRVCDVKVVNPVLVDVRPVNGSANKFIEKNGSNACREAYRAEARQSP